MKTDSHNSDQFIISYELLHALYWLLKYEEAELSKLIHKSFAKGLKEKMKTSNAFSELQLSEDMQNSIIDFFTFMEEEILDFTDQETTKLMNKDMIKDLDHFDPKQVDFSTVKKTISKNATKFHAAKYSQKTRTHFLKELLKHWNPQKEKSKKTIIN